MLSLGARQNCQRRCRNHITIEHELQGAYRFATAQGDRGVENPHITHDLPLPGGQNTSSPAPVVKLYRLTTGAGEDVFLPTWEWQVVRYMRVLDPTVPLSSGRSVGTLQLVFDGDVIAAAPLTVLPSP